MEGLSDSKYFTTADPPACSPGWYWRRRCRHVDELRVAQGGIGVAAAATFDELSG